MTTRPSDTDVASTLPGGKYRVSFTLSPEVSDSLTYCAQAMGISRSALLDRLLADSLPRLEKFISKAKSLPLADSDTQKRMRGESIDIILDALKQALKAIR
jgi:hypothetical protein